MISTESACDAQLGYGLWRVTCSLGATPVQAEYMQDTGKWLAYGSGKMV